MKCPNCGLKECCGADLPIPDSIIPELKFLVSFFDENWQGILHKNDISEIRKWAKQILATRARDGGQNG